MFTDSGFKSNFEPLIISPNCDASRFWLVYRYLLRCSTDNVHIIGEANKLIESAKYRSSDLTLDSLYNTF